MLTEDLIEAYKRDFFLKTGKGIKISICSRWETVCLLPVRLPLDVLMELALDANGWKWDDVFTTCKRAEFVYRRGLIFYILVKCGYPFLQVARHTNRDHTSVMYAIKNFEDKLDSEPLTGKVLLEVMEFIKTNYSLYLKSPVNEP